MSYVVVMTGGIGSGKTAVSDRLQALGACVVDADVISRELTAAGGAAMPALVAEFGPEVQAADGSLDRDRMRALVFADAGQKKRLEAILHPMIRAEAFRQVQAAADAPYVLVVVPLLVESQDYLKIADRVLVVDCPEEIQVERTMRRSGLARDQVERIIAAQAPRSARLALADDVVVNDSGLDELTAKVDRLHARYLQAAEAKRRGASAEA